MSSGLSGLHSYINPTKPPHKNRLTPSSRVSVKERKDRHKKFLLASLLPWPLSGTPTKLYSQTRVDLVYWWLSLFIFILFF
ncbi:hypothetical protein L2E82_32170 [Cichorium intybus]|uniref:Uncharacterized protein n=1 Tax=Cichorium intybus TaxID=13427 RepID=A0ACB9BIZ9_CICIN|nr:hypothetical protein L2E82_32170 [Cichorium intybus]